MLNLLTSEQISIYRELNEFASVYIQKQALLWEKQAAVPREIIEICAAKGYLGATAPLEEGGLGWDCLAYGLLNEVFGRFSTSLTGLFNVHTMVIQTILKWGTTEQKKKYLPDLITGKKIGALALTEPMAGSDLQMIETNYIKQNDYLILNGIKRWITFGALADMVIVFGKMSEKPVACIVEKCMPGFVANPVTELLGFRAAHLAVLEFTDCRIPVENILGKPGFAFSFIAPYALEFGRISVAWAALGILNLCLEICGKYVYQRRTFKKALIGHGMIQSMIAEMGVDAEAAKLLCYNACLAKSNHQADATEKILIAKYFAARAAVRQAAKAIQIMGAAGYSDSNPVARIYRDSKALEIIEGSNQISEMILGPTFAKKARSQGNYAEDGPIC